MKIFHNTTTNGKAGERARDDDRRRAQVPHPGQDHRQRKMSHWKDKTVPVIRQALADRGAKTTGKKEELINRLVAYEENDNFQGPAIILPEVDAMPEFPPTAFFRTLTTSDRKTLPPITKSIVEQYVLYRQVQDEEQNRDVSAFKKGDKMSEEAILAVSHVLNAEGDCYLTGMVAAEMRKNTAYIFKIVMKDTGEIKGTNCECPVGKGSAATCKHVVGVLLMVSEFVKTGQLKVELTCTEKIQTFKKPAQVHSAAPVEAEKLGRGAPVRDPRPPEFRNMPGYNDLVRNEIINFCANSNLDLSMRYVYDERADLACLVQQHDYLKEPISHY